MNIEDKTIIIEMNHKELCSLLVELKHLRNVLNETIDAVEKLRKKDSNVL